MPQELIDETSWVRESNQVAACQLNYRDAQPLLCHAPLKLDWKQTVITARNHAYRNIRPGLKTARVAEYRIGLLALMRFALLDHIGRNVMEKICDEVEIGAVAAAVSRLRPCSCSPGVFPHSPGVSPGAGIIAFTKTSMHTGTRSQTSGAVKPPRDCATRIGWLEPIICTVRSV